MICQARTSPGLEQKMIEVYQEISLLKKGQMNLRVGDCGNNYGEWCQSNIYFPKSVMKNFECAFRNGSVYHYEETRSLNFKFLDI